MRRLAAHAIGPLLFALSGAVGAACPDSKDSEAFFTEALRLQAEGKPEDAIVCQQRGVALAGETLKAVRERQVLAKLLEQNGKLTESVAILKLTLPQVEKLSGPATEATGDLLQQLGWAEHVAGTLPVPDAEAHLRRAHSIYAAQLGPRHIKVARTLNSLGVVLRELGQYEGAESSFANALEVATNGLSPDDDLRAAIYNNVAGLWYYRGDYRRALENFKIALPIHQRLHGEVSTEVGKIANNIGAVSEEIGDYETARTYYTRALAIQEKLLGPMHPIVGGPVGNLATLYYSLGDTVRAEQFYKRALQIYESSLGSDHPQVAQVLVHYGMLKRDLGQSEIARDFLERALKIQEATYGPDSVWSAESLNALAPLYQSLRQNARANEALVRSIGISAAGDEPQTLLTAYGNYAEVLAANGELAAAAFYGKFAVNLAQQIRNDVSALGQAVQNSFLARRQQLYRHLADRLIALGRLAEAEQVMTMLKEEEFFDFVRVSLRTSDGGSTRADFSAIERPYADNLGEISRQLQVSGSKFRSADGSAEQKESRRVALTKQQVGLRATLATISSALGRRPATRQPTPAASNSREGVAPGTAVVRYLVTEQRVRMIVAMATETIDTQVAIGLPQLNRLVFELRQAVQNPKSDPLPTAKTLHQLLIAPLQLVFAHGNISSIKFELDGSLRYVPFAALHDGKSFLIERFDLQQRTLANSMPQVFDATHVPRLAGFGVSKAVGGFSALSSVGAELDRIVRRSPEDRDGVLPGILLMDEAFTESSLRDTLAKDYSLIHIASHFVFRPGPLSDSYLLLGNGESLTLEHLRDGKFSLANVQLLTLSACSTAMGESSASGGELESFGVLAQRLGAREVLASLWPVADRSTSVLMLNMYSAVDNAKLPTAQGLRRAQLALLKGEQRFAPYAHPFYWAPFILMSSAASAGR